MKFMVIGFGQCGNRIADEFARLDRRAHSSRGIEILTGAFAVDTDTAALRELYTIKAGDEQRIVIGEAKTGGHGTGKRSELGAEIAREEGFKIVDTIRQTRRFSETDAFLLIASAAGGTGSGAMPVLAKLIKERYAEIPVYSLVVLPFEHEEEIEKTNIQNTAVCLNSIYYAADAVFLVDNQRYVGKGLSLRGNITNINKLIVDPFYSLLCVGEEKNRKHIGVTMLDAGDIKQTISGWTAIGYGKSPLHLITFPWDKTKTQKGIRAMDEAVSELSVKCETKNAAKALYILSSPEKEMNIDLVRQLGDHLRSLAPEATVRYGDYPINKGMIDITIVISNLKSVEKVETYYATSRKMAEEVVTKKEIQPESSTTAEEASNDAHVPSQ
ncbi:MAG: tubulin/FtsZ family protein [Chloroflexota bacterium]